ncbi:MAG: hypothetical protein J4432_04060 [DPANN group archaeon]|nr:hypothetical protein [DPANN group archaeon]
MTNVLVPIITGLEADQAFIDKLKEYDKIVLLFVADSNDNIKTGSIGARIKKAEATIEGMKKKLKTKNVVDYLEWGSWEDKARNIFKKDECKDIIVRDKRASKLFEDIKKANVYVYS